jgi:hypothetical protein
MPDKRSEYTVSKSPYKSKAIKSYVLRYPNRKDNNRKWIVVGEKENARKAEKQRRRARKEKKSSNATSMHEFAAVIDELDERRPGEYTSSNYIWGDPFEFIDCGLNGYCRICKMNENNSNYHPEDDCPEYRSNMNFSACCSYLGLN